MHKRGQSLLKTSRRFSKPQLLIFTIAFALIGYLIFRSFALNPNLPGDLNNDNTVNITDLSILLSNYGTSNTTADINTDGTVNVLDLSILLSHYGQSYTPATSNVFTGYYFSNPTLSGTPVLARTDPTINFDWGSGSADPSLPADNFSVRWIGDFTFEAATYTFNVTTNDGMRIYVDNNLVLDQWQDQAASFSPTYTATAGTHQVKVEYYEGANTAKAQVSWNKQTTGGEAAGPMIVGLVTNAVGSAAAQDAHGAVNYARVDTHNQLGQIPTYISAGMKVIMLIPGVSATGDYDKIGGVASINATDWASGALSYWQSQCGSINNCPALEVLNEPAGDWFWGPTAGNSASAAAYANLLKTTYNTFHNVLGANSPKILGSYDGGHAGSPVWGQAVYAADPSVGNYVDGWTDHPYGQCSSSYSAQGDRTSVTNFHAATNKPIWISEVGWPTAVGQGCTGDSAQWTESQQADNIYNFVQWARSTGYVGGVFIYDFHDDGGNALYGVERGDGTKKPSYNALKCAAQNLAKNC